MDGCDADLWVHERVVPRADGADAVGEADCRTGRASTVLGCVPYLRSVQAPKPTQGGLARLSLPVLPGGAPQQWRAASSLLQ